MRVQALRAAVYLLEGECLVLGQWLSSFSTQLDVQVVGDVVARNAAGGFSRVIADLAIRGELEELWEETE